MQLKEFDLVVLKDMYCNQNLSLREIAKTFGTTHITIRKKLKKIGIEIRPANSIIYYEGRRSNPEEYSEEDWTIDSTGYKSKNRIRQHKLVKGLNTTGHIHHIDFNKLNNDPINLFEFGSNSIHKMYHAYIKANGYIEPSQYVEFYTEKYSDTIDNYDWLYEHYISKGLSANMISKIIGVSRNAVTNRLKLNSIWDLRPKSVN